jgi:hypothetical protein
MRLLTLSLIVATMSAAFPAVGTAQTATDSIKPKKPTSKLGKIAERVADTAATTAAGAGVQSLLGKKAGGVANALGAGGVNPCGPGYGATAGAAIVGAAKGIVKNAADTGQAAATDPCGRAGAVPGMPAGIPGIPSGVDAATAAAMAGAMAGAGAGGGGAAAAGMNPLGGMGAVASMTPIGLAAGAAPGAIKGVKGLLGGKPQDKTVMLRDLGRGKLELKQVKFIEGTQEFEPGFEASFATFAEAIALVEGTYLMHVSAESPREKGAEPETVLARKRVAKVWALMAASGVSDQRVIPMSELPEAMHAGRKLPKAGDVKVEIIKFEKQP